MEEEAGLEMEAKLILLIWQEEEENAAEEDSVVENAELDDVENVVRSDYLWNLEFLPK